MRQPPANQRPADEPHHTMTDHTDRDDDTTDYDRAPATDGGDLLTPRADSPWAEYPDDIFSPGYPPTRSEPDEMTPANPGTHDPPFGNAKLCRTYRNVKTAVKAYDERLGVESRFVPFGGRAYNRLRLLYWATRQLTTLRPTRSSITRMAMVEDLAMFGGANHNPSCIPHEVFWLNGAYRTDAGARRRIHYANPRYVHHHTLSSVTSDEERRAWLGKYARMGFVSPAMIAPHFGLAHAGKVKAYIEAIGYPWAEKRRAGIVRMERTWALCERWGYSPQSIAEAFGVAEPRVRDGIRARRDAGFRAPEQDPTIPEDHRGVYDHANVDIRDDQPAGFETRVRPRRG